MALLLTFTILLVLLLVDDLTRLGFPRGATTWPTMSQEYPHYDPFWEQAARRFWLYLYGSLAHRVRRIWRWCRRHYGWGLEILRNAEFLNRLNW